MDSEARSVGSSDSSEDMAWDTTVFGTGAKNPNFNSIDEVGEAIDAIRKAIMETDENTKSRKDLVLGLIKLRICYEDLKDREHWSKVSPNFEARGHTFVSWQSAKKPIPWVSEASRVYCQQCTYGIWVHLQGSHHCQECGFSVHTNCMGNIMRGCVGQKIRTKPDFILEICPEKSLAALKYRCVECDVVLSPSDTRLCDYTGLSFCGACHWGATSPTPARIVHNWDFQEYPVSQATKQYLYLMIRKPVINVRDVNPKLFAVVGDLSQVDHLRKMIILMKKYLVVCRIASEQKILLHLVARQHFVDGPDLYSLQDLMDVHNGSLIKYLDGVIDSFKDHIYNCTLCLAKGFICEICDNGNPVNAKEDLTFPFDEDAKTCLSCDGVFHKHCLLQVAECPKCKRTKRSSNSS